MTGLLLAVDDGIIAGKLDIADFMFLVAAILFGIVTFMHFSARAIEAAITTLGFCLVAIGLLAL